MAVGQKQFLPTKGIDAYDSIQATVEWELPSGGLFTSSFFTNWIDPEKVSAMSEQKIKVIGTTERYEADQKRRGICVVTDEKGIEEPNPDFCSMYGSQPGTISFQGYGIDSFVQFFNDALNVEAGKSTIKDLEKKRPTFKESLIPTIILEAANKSLRENGQWKNIVFTNKRFEKIV